MTRRQHPAPPNEPATNRRLANADRRDDAKRRKIEMLLDRGFRPGRWAARLAYTLGLQSARPIRVVRHQIAAERSRGVPPLRIAFASDFHAGATTDARCSAPHVPRWRRSSRISSSWAGTS
jgi:hypothetical protein